MLQELGVLHALKLPFTDVDPAGQLLELPPTHVLRTGLLQKTRSTMGMTFSGSSADLIVCCLWDLSHEPACSSLQYT